jgi:hypothetical protein
MSFNLHFAERPNISRTAPQHRLSICLVALLFVALISLLTDAMLTGGANIRGFHDAVRSAYRI